MWCILSSRVNSNNVENVSFANFAIDSISLESNNIFNIDISFLKEE